MKNDGKKLITMSPGVKASLAYLIASVLTSAIAYFTTPIYTRLLDSNVYGQTVVFLTWINVFGIVAMFSLQAGVFNNGMVEYPEDRDSFAFSSLVLSNTITVIFGALVFIFREYIVEELKLDSYMLLLMIVIFLTQPAYNFWVSKQRYEYKYKQTVVISLLLAFISPLIAIICINCFNNKLYARIFGAEVPLIVAYLCFYIFLLFKSKVKFKFKYFKEAFLFNLPLIPHYLSAYLLGSSDKLMISFLIGDVEAAYYSVAHSIAMVVTIVWSAANASLIPFIYEKCKEKNYQAISKVTMPILSFFGIICCIIVVVAPELMKFMATSEYYCAVYAIPPLIGGVFFQVQYYMFANILYYYKKTWCVMVSSLISVFLNIFLNFIFIPKYGFIAAAYTTIVSYFVQASLNFVAMRWIVKCNVYDIKKVGIISLGVVLVSLLFIVTYDFIYIRYGILLVVIIVCVFFRKKILEIIHNLLTLNKKKETINEK